MIPFRRWHLSPFPTIGLSGTWEDYQYLDNQQATTNYVGASDVGTSSWWDALKPAVTNVATQWINSAAPKPATPSGSTAPIQTTTPVYVPVSSPSPLAALASNPMVWLAAGGIAFMLLRKKRAA